MLLLDAGNIFAQPGLLAQLKADVALNAMAIMRYDCLNLGNKEFVFGTDFILDGIERYGLSAVSANIVDGETADFAVSPSTVITFDSFTVGITGILAAKYDAEIIQANDNATRGLAVLDDVAALEAEVAVLRNRVDVLIVLANVGLEAARNIAMEIDGIDVIVVGHGADETVVPMHINGAYIVKAGYFGQTVGNLKLSLDDDNRITEARGITVTLDKSIAEDSEILELMDTYHRSLEQYKEELFSDAQVEPDAGKRYMGFGECVTCHITQRDTWMGSVHALAIDSLTDVYQEYNPECVNCHVTGMGYLGGFQRPDLTPEMAGVQCEMCHGAGGAHLEAYFDPYGEITDKQCVVCHTGEKDPTFDFEADKELVCSGGTGP